jgi:hypothetical protein
MDRGFWCRWYRDHHADRRMRWAERCYAAHRKVKILSAPRECDSGALLYAREAPE